MYIGPETMMPLASMLAAVAGVLLMFWGRFIGFVRTAARFATRTLSSMFSSR